MESIFAISNLPLLLAVGGTTISIKTIMLVLLGIICIVAGLIGCVIQVIPGTPLSWTGLLLLFFTPYAEYTSTFLIIAGAVVVVVEFLDYILPSALTEKLGGTKAGKWGSTIGLIVGIFIFPPITIILGPIIGAFIGELVAHNKTETALRSAMAAFLGFLLSTGLKLIVSGFFAFWFFKELLF